MTPYKGIIRIRCETKGACALKLIDNVQADCMACPDAVTEVLDLEGKVLHESRALAAIKKKPAKAKKGVKASSK